MNYANLEKEISTYKSISNQDEQTFNKLSHFFKTISKQGIIFTEKVKLSLEEFIQEFNKESLNTTYTISLSRFCLDIKQFLDGSKFLFSSIEKNIIEKITDFI